MIALQSIEAEAPCRVGAMIVIKTLRADGNSPAQGHPWPLPTQEADGSWTPGSWLVSARARATPLTVADVDACAPAIYACRPADLAYWVADRAWWCEMDGAVEGQDKVGAVRGRLLRPVEGWTPEILTRWMFWCADRAVRVHAVAALRSAGLGAQAERLAAPPEIVGRATADRAEVVATDAARAAKTAGAVGVARAVTGAAWTAWVARVAGVARAGAGDMAAWAAADTAWAAWAAGADRFAESRLLSLRLAEMLGIEA